MITGFQIRASRSCLSLYLKDIANKLGIHYSTLTRLEAQTANLSYINSNTRTSLLLRNFYQDQGIFYPQYNSIGINSNSKNTLPHSELSRFQLKVSRVALRLSRKKLGSLIHIPETSIAGWETNGTMLSPFSPHDSSIIDNLKQYFSTLGIVYPQFNVVELKEDPVERNI